MQCKNCGGEKFSVFEKHSSEKFDAERRQNVRSIRHDWRKILCEGCNTVYGTNTELVSVYLYNPVKMRISAHPIAEYEPHKDRVAQTGQGLLLE
jgi:hypothetical protein